MGNNGKWGRIDSMDAGAGYRGVQNIRLQVMKKEIEESII